MLRIISHGRLALALAAMQILGGCEKPMQAQPDPMDEQRKSNPAGRFQAVAADKGRVWVVDTRFGHMRLCAPAGDTAVNCGTWLANQ